MTRNFLLFVVFATLLGCQTTGRAPSGPDFDPPKPNVIIIDKNQVPAGMRAEYSNLLGTWNGEFRGRNGRYYKKIQMTFYDIVDETSLRTIYGWGTYIQRPYKPGLSYGITSFEGLNGKFNNWVSVKIKSPEDLIFKWNRDGRAHDVTMKKVPAMGQ